MQMLRKMNAIWWHLTYREVNHHFRLNCWTKNQNSIGLLDKVICKAFPKLDADRHWLTKGPPPKLLIFGKMMLNMRAWRDVWTTRNLWMIWCTDVLRTYKNAPIKREICNTRISWSLPRTHWIYLKTWENQFLPNYSFPLFLLNKTHWHIYILFFSYTWNWHLLLFRRLPVLWVYEWWWWWWRKIDGSSHETIFCTNLSLNRWKYCHFVSSGQ